MPNRRELLKWMGLGAASGSLGLSGSVSAAALPAPAPAPANGAIDGRPPRAQRRFTSPAVERRLAEVKRDIADPKLARLFENCYPNTLDTTVELGTLDGRPDTFVVTGDIDAMWLRDSSGQVQPYLPLARDDAALRRLYQGLIARQARCILIDPYANAFMPRPSDPPLRWSLHDSTDMRPGVGERKWEIDSLCYPIRLAHGYWRATGDRTPFDDAWRQAMRRVLATFREQQRLDGPGPYRFQRSSEVPTETQFLGGYGNPTRPNGMIHSMFRPSDDACLFPLLVPSNLFAVRSLRQLAELSEALHADTAFATQCRQLANEVETAVHRDGVITDAHGQRHWAYEVDGYGNRYFMDDANVPSLLSLPYLGCCAADDPLYRRTRARVWSTDNPYFFRGRAGEGIGSPHEGLRTIWPMSIIVRALTSDDAGEIAACLTTLRDTDAGTGFMHEAFDQDDPAHYTRAWFAWANSLFGELIVDIHQRHPALLRR